MHIRVIVQTRAGNPASPANERAYGGVPCSTTAVALVWAIVAIGLGVFAPRVEHALSGAGWEASGSESLQVRETLDREFGGLSSSALMVVVHSDDKTVADLAFKALVVRAQDVLAADARVTAVVPPQPGQSISRDGHTAVIQAGAGASSNEMVRAADDLKEQLAELPADGLAVSLTARGCR
jgi:RND superfamily putative drug exporter